MTLAYDEREAKQTLSQQFDVQVIPSLALLDGSSWETITTDGRRNPQLPIRQAPRLRVRQGKGSS